MRIIIIKFPTKCTVEFPNKTEINLQHFFFYKGLICRWRETFTDMVGKCEFKFFFLFTSNVILNSKPAAKFDWRSSSIRRSIRFQECPLTFTLHCCHLFSFALHVHQTATWKLTCVYYNEWSKKVFVVFTTE